MFFLSVEDIKEIKQAIFIRSDEPLEFLNKKSNCLRNVMIIPVQKRFTVLDRCKNSDLLFEARL